MLDVFKHEVMWRCATADLPHLQQRLSLRLLAPAGRDRVGLPARAAAAAAGSGRCVLLGLDSCRPSPAGWDLNMTMEATCSDQNRQQIHPRVSLKRSARRCHSPGRAWADAQQVSEQQGAAANGLGDYVGWLVTWLPLGRGHGPREQKQQLKLSRDALRN